MSYGSLDKSRLINLEYSLFKEILRTNRAGSYSSSTILGCNTRKYHGFLVAPIPELDYEKHVLLSSVDVSVEQHGKVFNLGIHKYSGSHFEPRGHKYVEDFDMDPIPRVTYRVGGVVLQQELVLVENESQVLLKYTLLEANSPTIIKLKPFLAFRHMHDLTNSNLFVNTRYENINGGVKLKLYDDFPALHMQCNKENEFVPIPDWYKGLEYIKEELRGYPYSEDLYVPGFFEFPIAKGESVVFSACTKETKTKSLKELFDKETANRIPRNSLLNNLINSAQQFIVQSPKGTEVMAGYHWFGSRLRDTFVSLPGLTCYYTDASLFKGVLNSSIKQLRSEILDPITGVVKDIDVPLWLFWTLQKCAKDCGVANVWKEYGSLLEEILNYYRHHGTNQLHVTDEGLIYARIDGIPLTWMNAVLEGQPVTPRYGMPVEVNALWYNAIMYAVSLAKEAGDMSFVVEWQSLVEKIKSNFISTFWNEKENCLGDYCDGFKVDYSIRPNQIIAAALPFSPLSLEQKKGVLDVVQSELLIPVGLRSLSPKNPHYQGVIAGYVRERDEALHQGAAYPWLFAFYAEVHLDLHKQGGVGYIQRIVDGYEREMGEHCLGTISECYNGNPPHKATGAVSMAWNVTGVLRIIKLLESYI